MSRRLSRRFLSVAILLACVLTPASAGKASSHDEAVLELFQVMGLERNAVAGAAAMIEAQVQANPDIEPYRDVMLEWAGRFLTWDAMAPDLTAVYKATFTEREVREMTAFYRTPTGKKVLETLPKLMQKGAEVGMNLARSHQKELETMVLQRRKELEAAGKVSN
ncbi:MAG: DUF2059 domain-containing protein [Candidatus Polarisedimenticolia bacterium]